MSKAHSKSIDSNLELLTDVQVSQEFGIGLNQLRSWRFAENGGPPVVSIGRYRRYRRGSVNDWIAAQEQSFSEQPKSVEAVKG